MKDDVEDYVDDESPRSRTHTAELLARITVYGYEAEAVPEGGTLRTRAFLDAFPAARYYHINKLVELGLLEKIGQSGPEAFIWHERKERILNSSNLASEIDEEMQRLLDDVESNSAVREEVADFLDVDPSRTSIESAIRKGKLVQTMQMFDRVVKEIEWSEAAIKGAEYGRIGFRRQSNRYRLTPRAVSLVENAS